MAIQLPQRGQPLDYSYLYQLVEQVNALSAELARSKTSNYFNNDNPAQTVDSLSAADTKIVATTLKFDDNIKNTSDTTTKTIPFDNSGGGFKFPPIVAVTPQVAGSGNNTDLGKDVTVVVTAVTTNSVTVQVNYNLGKKKDVTLRLNVIAVGVRR